MRIDAEAQNLIYRLFRRFLPYEAFPGKTVNFTTALYEHAKAERVTEITSDRIISAFVKATGLPELFLRDEVSLEQHDLQAFFEHEVIGQPEACRAATSAVLTFKAGQTDQRFTVHWPNWRRQDRALTLTGPVSFRSGGGLGAICAP